MIRARLIVLAAAGTNALLKVLKHSVSGVVKRRKHERNAHPYGSALKMMSPFFRDLMATS